MNLLPTNPAARAILTGRPYWQCLYRDGSIVSEWDRDWALLKRKGLSAARLVCPNGQVGVVGNDGGDASERLFQFKIGHVLIGGDSNFLTERQTSAQVLGILTGLNGECMCWAWDYGQERLIGPFEDNFNAFLYGGVGPLSELYLGVKPN